MDVRCPLWNNHAKRALANVRANKIYNYGSGKSYTLARN
jgi:hypothetical protein